MKQITLESEEFKRVLHNLHLENMHLSENMQKKIVEISNQREKITSTLIKELLANDNR